MGRNAARLAVILALLTPGCWKKPGTELTAESMHTLPMTVYLKIDGGFYVTKDAWHLHYDTEKAARLTILRYPHSSEVNFTVSDEQLRALRELVIRDDFFRITRHDFGAEPGDDGFRGLRISAGTLMTSVSVGSLEGWRGYDAEELDELRRVLRAWNLIRGWFDAPSIVDFRTLDGEILAGQPAADATNTPAAVAAPE